MDKSCCLLFLLAPILLPHTLSLLFMSPQRMRGHSEKHVQHPVSPLIGPHPLVMRRTLPPPSEIYSIYSLLQSHRVELYVVVSHRAEGGQDLGEGRHDQVLAVSARSRREESNYISGTLLRNTQLFSQWYDARASFRIIFMGNSFFWIVPAREVTMHMVQL